MSSDTFSHQVPINGTIQTKVSPGNQTNLYYILVSNLPWQTSWQQLKDHVRTVSVVERVEVFNESTSGWVSVKGRQNYDAALRLLNGGIFNGRALLADGKNATESIMIRETVEASTTSGSASKTPHTPRFRTPPSTQYSASTPPLMSPPATGYGEWTSPTTPSSYTTTSTMEYTPYTMSTAMPYDYNEAPGCYSYDTPNSSYMDQSAVVSPHTMVQYPFEASYSQQYQAGEYQSNDYTMYSSMPTPESMTTNPSNAPNGMVPTRQRKVIVKQLQPWINFRQVQDLIRKKIGSDADKIQHIDLPVNESQASNRGYALITFQNEEVANKAIRRLNGYKYEGRELKVDYTKEGVSENEHVRSRNSGHRERREDRERKEKKESSRASGHNDKKSKSHKSHTSHTSHASHTSHTSHTSSVVIANGSSSSPLKKPDVKEKSSKRH
ncbi:hypothetical protein F5Y06DRAFT_240415 [Hypoxylon sp. FL0890]|nr:hypothetical protein F5Y06DRAFT_240415 [Hypoxylon sp. FL0890]